MSDLDQRTLPATPRRIAEFRRRGDVPLSRDLASVAAFVGAGVGTIAYSERTVRLLMATMSNHLQGHGSSMFHLLQQLALAVAPTGLGAVGGYALAVALQLGWPPALQSPKFDLSRLLSAESLMKILSPRAMAGRIATSVAKVTLVGAAGVLVLLGLRDEVRQQPVLEVGLVPHKLARTTQRLFWQAGSVLAALAIADFLWTKRSYARRLRMTPEEFRREHHEQEGDPQIKRRRRARMRELAKRRVPAAVRGADVVLVNPTEYAVALRYDSQRDRAPKVVAKGRGAAAERIRELARQAGVPIVPEPPLCRMLHKLVPEGREIPPQLFAAVAEVLAYVYRLRGRAA